MNVVRHHGSNVVIRQIPVLLFVVAGMFALPFLGFSLFHIVRGTDAEGKYFTLFLGLLFLWLILEFVATRERFDIDPLAKTLTRTVRGVFRTYARSVELAGMREIGVEWRVNSRGRRREHLFLYGTGEPILINSPAKVYLSHAKLGKRIAEATGIPFRGE